MSNISDFFTNYLSSYIIAFLVGGAICAIVQIFIDKTKL